MSRYICWIGISVLLVGIFGCVEKKVVWSPNGQWAVVFGDNGIYLCDSEGNLTKPVGDEAGRIGSTKPAGGSETGVAAGWFKDSQRFMVVVAKPAYNWEKIADAIPKDRRNELIAQAEFIRRQILEGQTGWKKLIDDSPKFTNGERNAIKFHIYHHLNSELSEKLGKDLNKLKAESVDVFSLKLFELTNGGFRSVGIRTKTINRIRELRISPNQKTVAYVENMPGESKASARLFVATIQGKFRRIRIADRVSWYPDWSADGQNIVYIRAIAGSGLSRDHDIHLGVLTSQQVCNDEGILLNKDSGKKEMVGLLFDDLLGVRCFSDGRILFSASHVNLPCTANDMPQHKSLFVVDLRRNATVIRAIPRGTETKLGYGTLWFEVSPDEKRVSIANDKGAIMILTLAVGKLLTVQQATTQKNGLRTLPVWRSNDELCFAALPGTKLASPDQAEIVLWSAKGSKCISKNWPVSVRKEFLKK